MIVRLIFLILLLPVLIVGMAWVTMSLGLPDPLPAIISGVVALLYLIGLVVYLIRHVLRAGRALDAAFGEAGLRYSGRMGVACCYEGAIGGRKAEASLMLAYYFQPWRIDVKIVLDPGGPRVALGSTRPLLDCRGVPRLDPGEPAYRDAHIHAEDGDAARRWLARPEVLEALRPLLEEGRRVNSWELYVQPQQLWLRVRMYRLDEAAVGRWVSGLGRLAEVCGK